MRISSRFMVVLFTAALVTAGCGGGDEEPSGSGGTAGRGGASGTGGAAGVGGMMPPGALAPCDTQNYPCSPSEESEAVRALVQAVRTDIHDRLDAGESFDEIAGALLQDGDVIDAQFSDHALRFRVEGSGGHWVYDTSLTTEPVALDEMFPGAAAAKRNVSSTRASLVLREDDDPEDLKKKALIVEPFAWQIPSPTTARWIAELEDTHDYESVDHQIVADIAGPQIDDVYFRNWNDFRFVWVITHGTLLPGDDGTEYSVLFSSKTCGYSAWLLEEQQNGNGLEPTKNGNALGLLFGAKYSTILNELTDAQDGRARQFISAENVELALKGQICESMTLPTVNPPIGSTVAKGLVELIAYDEGWFSDNFPSGLEDVFLYLRSCTAAAVPLSIGSGTAGAIVGWSEIINAGSDNLTHGVLFERLITRAETLQDGLLGVQDAGANAFFRDDGIFTELQTRTGRGDRAIRVRENISIVDPGGILPLPDEGGELQAREITTDGKTIVDMHLLVSGFGRLDLDDFKVRVFDWNDNPLTPEIDVADPVGFQTFMTVGFELDERVTEPKEFEVEARVSLPESTSPKKYGRHRIKATVLPVAETQWRITAPGLGTVSGPIVSAPTVTGIPTDDGGIAWQLLLTQELPGVIPSAGLVIKEHEGRRMDCTGQTGMFSGALGILYTTDMNAPVYGGSGEAEEDCTSNIEVDILTFSQDDDLNIRLGGTLCKIEADPSGEGTLSTPVPFTGQIRWPRAGCGMMPPMNNLLGSYVSSEDTFLCIDVYDNSILAPTFEGVFCQTPGVTCSEETCTGSDLGQCDYRSDSAQMGFRGTVQHYRVGGDWPSVMELQNVCTAFGGAWSSQL